MNKIFTLKFWLTIIGEILIAVIIFSALSYWQESSMLESDAPAPTLSALSLDGKSYQFPLTSETSERTLVYFFAPWCTVCHLSIENLNIVRNQIDRSKLNIIIVALDYKSVSEVEEFLADHDLDFPIILGNQQWQASYKIKAFPSYYILNKQGDILSRSMGYSSSIGMLRRAVF